MPTPTNPDFIEWDISADLDPESGIGIGIFSGYEFFRKRQPSLRAHRPQASRFIRLSRIVGAARAIAFSELGPDGPDRLSEALVSLEDCKGDFTAIWQTSAHLDLFHSMIARALAMEGEDPIDQLLHRVADTS